MVVVQYRSGVEQRYRKIRRFKEGVQEGTVRMNKN